MLVVLAPPKLTTRLAAIESTQSTDPILRLSGPEDTPYGVMDLLRRGRLLGPALSCPGLAGSIRVTQSDVDGATD